MKDNRPKEIETTNGLGDRVVLIVTGPKMPMPLSGVLAYPVRIKVAEGPYHCTGWHVAENTTRLSAE